MKFMRFCLALALVANLVACGGSGGPTNPGSTLSNAPPPIVCTPQYPATLTTGYTLTGRGAAEAILREKAAIKVTFAWTPATAPTGVFVVPNNGTICNVGKACDNALASDYTTSPSPKVIRTEPLNPGSYLVVIENLSPQGIEVGGGTVVEMCK